LIDELGRQEYQGKMFQLSKLLEDLKNKHAVVLPVDLMVSLDVAIESLHSIDQESRSKTKQNVIKKVRALRTTKSSYADDGEDRVFDCHHAIKKMGLLNTEELNFLESLSEKIDQPDDAELQKLTELKKKLMVEVLPDSRPLILSQVISNDLKILLKQIADELNEELRDSSAGIDDVLSDYLSTLKYQRGRLLSSLENYTTTFGATCQGSVTPEMLRVMSSAGQDSLTFETVIIDEAARANPLDLFIPMSLAKRRIVLVGDPYQLPQMLEPKIEEIMKESGALKENYVDALRTSLFKRLYHQLEARQEADGIKRTVMLDTQFRMHPVIGDFVSANFYEAEGEKPIHSGKKADVFKMDLNKIGASVVNWVGVPNDRGKEKHVGGRSWQRKAEIEAVVPLVLRLLDAYTEASIGVITFHVPQRDGLFEALMKKGVCRKGEEGWEYEEEFVSTPNGEERIRVGTVDAFQGKEFDIVVLSMTRSNMLQGDSEEDWNRKFGFLRLTNRLNVAFSRAREALFVVGDKAMFLSKEARSAIPSVHAYAHDVCRDYT